MSVDEFTITNWVLFEINGLVNLEILIDIGQCSDRRDSPINL
jgi:hypothetical protein